MKRRLQNTRSVGSTSKAAEWRKPEIVIKVLGSFLSGAAAIVAFLWLHPVPERIEKLLHAVESLFIAQTPKMGVEPWGEIPFQAIAHDNAALRSLTPIEEALINSRKLKQNTAALALPAPPSSPTAAFSSTSGSLAIVSPQNTNAASGELDSSGQPHVLTIPGLRKPAVSHMSRIAKNDGLPDLTRAGLHVRFKDGESALAKTKEDYTTSLRVLNGSAILSFDDSSLNANAVEYVAKPGEEDFDVFTAAHAKLAIKANGDIDVLVTHVAKGDTMQDQPGMPLELLSPQYRIERTSR